LLLLYLSTEIRTSWWWELGLNTFLAVTGFKQLGLQNDFNALVNNNNIHLSCAHQHPERSHDTC